MSQSETPQDFEDLNDSAADQKEEENANAFSPSAVGDRVFMSVCQGGARHKTEFGVAYYVIHLKLYTTIGHSALLVLSRNKGSPCFMDSFLTGKMVSRLFSIILKASTEPGLSVVETIKLQVLPSCIVTASAQNEEFSAFLAKNDLDPSTIFNIQAAKKGDFSLQAAKNRLSLLQVEELSSAIEITNKQERLLHFMSVIDFSKNEAVCAIGGLISFLLKNGPLNSLEAADDPVVIKNIQAISLDTTMFMDRMTLRALSIFVEEDHPGATRRSKEGLSLFGILNHTKTLGGSRTLTFWFDHPSQQRSILNQRLGHIEFFLREGNEDLVAELRTVLAGVKDVHRVLIRFANHRANVNDWTHLQSSLQAFIALQAIIGKVSIRVPVLEEFSQTQSAEVLELSQVISTVVNFDSSDVTHVSVMAGVCQELDQLKKRYERLEDFLGEVATKDMVEGRLPESITSLSIVYFPQLGYLLKVPRVDGSISPNTEIPGLSVHFATAEHVYFKNARMEQLDQNLGDLQGQIEDMESKIIRELEAKVLAAKTTLGKLASTVYELDCLLALSVAAHQYELVRPVLTDELGLQIEDGRHILQEMVVDQYIPNSSTFHPLESRIHVLTGPNSSGKSVYMKQVLLIVYMAHIGSFVPAKAATIGICDRILTRLRSNEAITSSMSSFSSDSSQIAFMLRNCTPRSVVLIDEYGKGTARNDGIALLASIIRLFQTWEASGPRVLIATHFHELFTRELIEESKYLSFFTMSFTKAMDDSRDDGIGELIFLYKLKPGIETNSFGFHCALRAGMDSQFVQRAKQISQAISQKLPITPLANLQTSLQKHAEIIKAFRDLELPAPGTYPSNTPLPLRMKQQILKFLAKPGFVIVSEAPPQQSQPASPASSGGPHDESKMMS
eukprot:g61266.t1